MKDTYAFRKIRSEEIPEMYSLILQRIKWMDRMGIHQWNTTRYEDAYPEAYFIEESRKGELFVLTDRATGEIVSAAVLKEEDERWEQREPSLYLHNFVAKVGRRGAGTSFLQYAEAYAVQNGKQYFRLDSAKDNEFLAGYYQAHGFVPVGTCKDGPYEGILRQKKLDVEGCKVHQKDQI